MDNVIDLTTRRDRPPDSDCVCHDFRTDHIDTTFRFCGHYTFDGAQWSIEVWAHDFEEAERKLAAISSGKIDGQVMSVIPA